MPYGMVRTSSWSVANQRVVAGHSGSGLHELTPGNCKRGAARTIMRYRHLVCAYVLEPRGHIDRLDDGRAQVHGSARTRVAQRDELLTGLNEPRPVPDP